VAIAKKFVVAPNAATRELWRVAESGEIDELEDLNLLAQANINARNEHGMTALMRAANHGRVEMVRVLLEHGADPNITRNDNFTALSLAAFFGHTEIVEMLIGYGAETDVATRYGTSAQMWAKARSFGDVAQCLQKRRKEEVALPTPTPTPTLTATPTITPTPKPTPAPILEPEPEPEFAQPELEAPLPAVRTLSEPPEIWDLVHEAPRDFSAGTAFVARVGSITAGVVLGVVAFLVVAGGIAGAWYWKQTRPQPVIAAPLPVTNATSNAASIEPAPAVTAPADNPIELPPISVPVVRRNTARRSVIKPQVTEPPVETTASAPAVPVAPKVDLRTANTDAAPKKSATPLSPQLISPPKPQQPKGKVIQWP
jgi:hypothetical protein